MHAGLTETLMVCLQTWRRQTFAHGRPELPFRGLRAEFGLDSATDVHNFLSSADGIVRARQRYVGLPSWLVHRRFGAPIGLMLGVIRCQSSSFTERICFVSERWWYEYL